MNNDATNDRSNLEHLIHEALERGAPSISLVRDPEGRYQCSVGRKQSGVFGVHIANHPIEAMFGALGGVDAVQAFRGRGITKEVSRPIVVDPDLEDLL